MNRCLPRRRQAALSSRYVSVLCESFGDDESLPLRPSVAVGYLRRRAEILERRRRPLLLKFEADRAPVGEGGHARHTATERFRRACHAANQESTENLDGDQRNVLRVREEQGVRANDTPHGHWWHSGAGWRLRPKLTHDRLS